MLALLLLEVNWICVLLRLVSTQLDSYFCIIEERVPPEGYVKSKTTNKKAQHALPTPAQQLRPNFSK